MNSQGMSFTEAGDLMRGIRPLTKLESRHQKQIDTWLAATPQSTI
jgi:hypothetical protein